MTNVSGGQVNASLDDDEDEIEESEGGGLDAKKLLIFVFLPLLIIGGGAGAYFMGVFDKAAEEQTELPQEKMRRASTLRQPFLKFLT